MGAGGTRRRSRLELGFLAAVVAFVALLFADNLATERSERTVHDAALSLANNAGPSVERLSAVNGLLHEVALELALGHPAPDAQAKPQRLVDDAYVQWQRYRRLPVYDGERELQGASEEHWRVLRSVLPLGGPAALQAVERVRGDVFQALDLNVRSAQLLSTQIGEAHHVVRALSLLADAAAGALVLLIGAAVLRALRQTRSGFEREAARISERATELEAFSSRMAHDVLSPLGAQTIAWDMVERAHPEDDRIRAWAQRARAGLRRTQVLVEGLLGFALAGARPRPGERARVAAVVADVLSGVEHEAAAAGVQLSADVPESLEVAMSVGVLTSVVLNLVRNAIKYMGARPVRRVAVRGSPDATRVRVEVTDTGPGIPPESLERIFEPYVRGEGVSTPGVGLGLATVKRLCEAHGGRVVVRSTPGEGSTFVLELPAAA